MNPNGSLPPGWSGLCRVPVLDPGVEAGGVEPGGGGAGAPPLRPL